MAQVIQFPKRTETQTLRFDEKHAFGEVGGLMLSLVQEQDKADAPYTLVLYCLGSGMEALRRLQAPTRLVSKKARVAPSLFDCCDCGDLSRCRT